VHAHSVNDPGKQIEFDGHHPQCGEAAHNPQSVIDVQKSKNVF